MFDFYTALPRVLTHTHTHTDREWCGEGLQWAGCTLITLLGQQKRFEALDFCYHLLRVHEVDRQDADLQGVVRKKAEMGGEGRGGRGEERRGKDGEGRGRLAGKN